MENSVGFWELELDAYSGELNCIFCESDDDDGGGSWWDCCSRLLLNKDAKGEDNDDGCWWDCWFRFSVNKDSKADEKLFWWLIFDDETWLGVSMTDIVFELVANKSRACWILFKSASVRTVGEEVDER